MSGASTAPTQPFAGAETVTLDSVYRLRVVDFPNMLFSEDSGLESLEADSGVKVAAAPFGGLLAICDPRHDTEVVVYTAAGRVMSRVTTTEEVEHLFWNERADHLIVVGKSGHVMFLGTDSSELFDPVQLDNVHLCTTIRNGIAAYLQDGTVVVLQLKNGQYVRSEKDVLEFMGPDMPAAMVALGDDVSQSRAVEVFIATEADQSKIVRVQFDANPSADFCSLRLNFAVRRMAVSFNGSRVAIGGEKGEVGVAYVSMEDYYPLAVAPDDVAVSYLGWAGDFTVAFVTGGELRDEIHFYSPATRGAGSSAGTGEFLTIPEGCTFVEEPDGIRCVGALTANLAHKFFQVVPDAAIRVYYKFGSTLPASLLRKAYDQYIAGDVESETTMRHLTGAAGGVVKNDGPSENFRRAIADVLETAGFEFDLNQQKRLLRIAAYAKGFAPTYDPSDFVSLCKRIRALRAIRSPSVGMMMSMAQFDGVRTDRLARRLTDQGHYRLAFEICKALGGRTEVVMQAWAKAKMHAMLEAEGVRDGRNLARHEDAAVAKAVDENIQRELLKNMRHASKLNYVWIADEARRCGREHLFIKLLEQEPQVTNRVEALKHYGLMDQALAQAVDSGNASLVYNCLIQLANVPAALLPKLASIDHQRGDSTATDLACVYLTHFASAADLQKETVKMRPALGVHLHMLQYFEAVAQYRRIPMEKRTTMYESAMLQIQSTLSGATEAAGDARRFVRDRDAEAEFGAMEKLLKQQDTLINKQKELAKEASDMMFLNMSILQTLQRCWELSLGQAQFVTRAGEFAKQFNVSEKQNQWAKLRAYTARRSPQAIADMGNAKGGSAKKSLLPPLAYIEALMKLGALELATLFVAKMPRIEDRLEYYVQCRAWSEAANECIKHNQPGMLDLLRSRAAHHPGAVDIVDRVARQ